MREANQKWKMIRSTKLIKIMTNEKGCRREKGAFASKVGTEPDESVKGCVRHCISILSADEGSAS